MEQLIEQVYKLNNGFYITIILISYLVGSIPFGLIIGKLVGIKDIRSHGSGNIGATNVFRVAGKTLGIITLSLDMLKGALTVLIVKDITQNDLIIQLSMVMVIIGHIFPIWLKGRGGKGVATALASFLAYNYVLGMIGISLWLVTFAITRTSSLAAIITFIFLPMVALVLPNPLAFKAILFVSFLVIVKHRSNIIRLLNGTERKIDIKTKQ